MTEKTGPDYRTGPNIAVAAETLGAAIGNTRARIRHDQELAQLRAVVPDGTERQGYLDITMGNPTTAWRIASHGVSVDTARAMRAEGVPAGWIPDLAEYGPEQAGQIANILWEFAEHGIAVDHHAIHRLLRQPPPSPEEFRRRALEARRNRGTGPTRRDNRRWRNT